MPCPCPCSSPSFPCHVGDITMSDQKRPLDADLGQPVPSLGSSEPPACFRDGQIPTAIPGISGCSLAVRGKRKTGNCGADVPLPAELIPHGGRAMGISPRGLCCCSCDPWRGIRAKLGCKPQNLRENHGAEEQPVPLPGDDPSGASGSEIPLQHTPKGFSLLHSLSPSQPRQVQAPRLRHLHPQWPVLHRVLRQRLRHHRAGLRHPQGERSPCPPCPPVAVSCLGGPME